MGFYWGDDVHLKVALGKETLKASVLFFEISDAGRVRGIYAAKASSLTAEGTLRNVVLAADLGDGTNALLGLLQELNNKTATICASVN